jgi:hypothetical protein
MGSPALLENDHQDVGDEEGCGCGGGDPDGGPGIGGAAGGGSTPDWRIARNANGIGTNTMAKNRINNHGSGLDFNISLMNPPAPNNRATVSLV